MRPIEQLLAQAFRDQHDQVPWLAALRSVYEGPGGLRELFDGVTAEEVVSSPAYAQLCQLLAQRYVERPEVLDEVPHLVGIRIPRLLQTFLQHEAAVRHLSQQSLFACKLLLPPPVFSWGARHGSRKVDER